MMGNRVVSVGDIINDSFREGTEGAVNSAVVKVATRLESLDCLSLPVMSKERQYSLFLTIGSVLL